MLEGREERLGGGVVERAADASHRLGDLELGAGRRERVGAILRALVGVEDHPGHGAAAHRGGHVERVCGQLRGGVAVGLREAQHPPGEQVLDGGEEHRPLAGVDLLEVADPLLVDAVGGEVPPQQVRHRLGPLVGAGQAPATAAGASLQALAGHRGLHRLLGHLAARPAQLGAHPGRAVGAA